MSARRDRTAAAAERESRRQECPQQQRRDAGACSCMPGRGGASLLASCSSAGRTACTAPADTAGGPGRTRRSTTRAQQRVREGLRPQSPCNPCASPCMAHLPRHVDEGRGREAPSRMSAGSTAGSARVSELHTQRGARLLAACGCAGLTAGSARLHWVGVASGVCGRGGQASSGRFLPSLAQQHQRQRSATRLMRRRAVYAESNGTALMCG